MGFVYRTLVQYSGGGADGILNRQPELPKGWSGLSGGSVQGGPIEETIAAPQLLPPRSSKAAAALRTHDDVCPALPAATHTDCVFEALHSVSGSEASLHFRLADVR